MRDLVVVSRLAALSLVLFSQLALRPAHALTIRDLEANGETRFIALDGQFEVGDDKKFIDKILGVERAAILLNSPGGMIEPALAIGRAIRLKGFDTIVHDGAQCSSACALVWLAGASRQMGERTKVGFHAAFVMENGQPVEKGAANAAVGAYLAMLGLSTRAIHYVTAAGPQSMSWLTFEEARRLGIAMERTARDLPPDRTRSAKTDLLRSVPAPADFGAQLVTAPGRQVLPNKVVLYEDDPANPAGNLLVGSARWRTEAVSPGAGEAAADLAIRVDVEIPDRRLAMTMFIRRNTDATLPATHTVEIVFNLRSDFAFGGVAGVLGLLMKDAHETRGVALSRLAVKVRKDFFLIGLSAVEADRQRNFMLLNERSWFDIPVVYDNGRRGIIAIEKGSEGGAAFEQALRRWHGEVHRHTDARQPSRLGAL
jgi:hypothetical protein